MYNLTLIGRDGEDIDNTRCCCLKCMSGVLVSGLLSDGHNMNLHRQVSERCHREGVIPPMTPNGLDSSRLLMSINSLLG